jgi:hypothetical protein
MTSGLAGIECRAVNQEDYPSSFELKPVEVMKTLVWLLGFV